MEFSRGFWSDDKRDAVIVGTWELLDVMSFILIGCEVSEVICLSKALQSVAQLQVSQAVFSDSCYDIVMKEVKEFVHSPPSVL